jgi:hypothetical protein
LSLRWVRHGWRLAIVVLAAGHTWVACRQQSMNSDGLNYLTLGKAFWHGDWDLAINGIWSPLYGVIAGGALVLLDPPLASVFPTVQVVNLAVFVSSLVCFERLWSELWSAYVERPSETSQVTLPDWLWWSIGYALFLWAGLNLIQIWSVTPDMLVAATVYLAASYLVRIGRGRGSRWSYLGFGVTLGVGYLAKAPMFPLAIVALTLAALTHVRMREAGRRMVPAVVGFLLISGPLVVTISASAGRPAFSEVSRFTYLKHVNRIPYPHWREGVVDGIGVPTDPPRLVHLEPDVYAFDGPVGGTYPLSFDPDHWTRGLAPRVTAFEQLNEIANSVAFYFALFFRTQGALLGTLGLLALIGLAAGARPRIRAGDWTLTVWALACFGMYALVFVTERYIGPFVLLFWAGILSYWRLPSGPAMRRISSSAGVLVVGFTLTNVAALNVDGFAALAGLRPPVEMEQRGQFEGSGGRPGRPPAVAAALLDSGVRPGQDVAYIGYSYTAFWAYLIDARIVAEIWPEQASLFWSASPDTQREVLDRFRETGARWAIAEVGPRGPSPEGWTHVGGTGYLLRPLQ